MNNIILSVLIIIITLLIIALLIWVIFRVNENFSNIDPMVAQLYANLSDIEPDVAKKITIKKGRKILSQ